MLELKTSYHDGILNIELYGALDSLTAPDFKHWLTQKSSGGYHHFTLNCGGLEFVSSRGIGILTELNNILNATEKRLILYHVSVEVLNLLTFLKLSDSMPIVENFAKAKERFEKNPRARSVKIEPTPMPVDQAPENPVEEETFEEIPPEVASTAPVGQTPDEIPVKINEPENAAPEESYVGISTTAETRPVEEKTLKPAAPPQSRPTMTIPEPFEEVDKAREEYIDLNRWDRGNADYNISKMNIVYCPNCGQGLRVTKKGLYLCPECRSKFNYPF